uniref:Putative ovule protein n=1 Tax=Solanum chacoense TaxID=4108 RepID=A0A0V0H6B9_SOLCH
MSQQSWLPVITTTTSNGIQGWRGTIMQWHRVHTSKKKRQLILSPKMITSEEWMPQGFPSS